MNAYETVTITIDVAILLVTIFGVFVAILIAVATGRISWLGPRYERIRATLTAFNQLRKDHEDFENKLKHDLKENPSNRSKRIRSHLADLERLAIGINEDAYDFEIVKKTSGSLLMRLHRKYFREFVYERRSVWIPESERRGKPEDVYIEYERMIKRLYEVRGETWEGIDAPDGDFGTLKRFLSMPVTSHEEVFAAFRELPGALECSGSEMERYLYVPGTREDRCLLVAHADTVKDRAWTPDGTDGTVVYRGVKFFNKDKDENPECILGADDRAGCAMLWLLRGSGHSLLITCGGTHGQLGSRFLKDSNPELFQELNDHTFILQLGHRGYGKYTSYSLPVPQTFKDFIKKETDFSDQGDGGQTDICVLCDTVSGANLSIGYYNEHSPDEELNYNEWKHTLDLVRAMLKKHPGRPLKRYPLE